MCKALIIGAGGVGTVVTQKIAANPVFTDVMLASRTKSKCDAVAAAIGGNPAKTAEAGADVVTFHYEATYNPKGCIEMIRNAGAKVGVSIKPATSVEVLRDILPQIDLVLIMSVEPGFGGQAFIPASLEKIAQLRALADELGTETIIEVDGGISSHNAHEVFGAGADVLVAGNAVFGAEDPQAEIVKMLNA